MQETWVQSLGQEDPLKKEVATCSRILAWEIPWTEEPGGLVHGVSKSRTCPAIPGNDCRTDNAHDSSVGVLCFYLFWPYHTRNVGFYFSDQGSNLCPLHWEHRVLTTGLLGKSQELVLLKQVTSFSLSGAFTIVFLVLKFYFNQTGICDLHVWNTYNCEMCFSWWRDSKVKWLFQWIFVLWKLGEPKVVLQILLCPAVAHMYSYFLASKHLFACSCS